MASFGHRFARRAEEQAAWGFPAQPLVLDHVRDVRLVCRDASACWKRVLDITLSVLGLVLTAPLMLATIVLIKATSPGPVFYRQERIGLNRRSQDRRGRSGQLGEDRRGRDRRVLVNFGRPFTIYKFRTMVVDAERGTPPMWAKERDPRITPLGRILRKTRIDELPQFLNVLRGDMSIVGPRPERAYFIGRIEKELPEFQLRLRAKPGITGLAQVELGYTNTDEGLRDKLRHDLEYIGRVSPAMDLKILLRTFFVVLTGRGAH
ncbi:MAG: sugar transferase [Candidatus Krumholzibacteria bacterium]|nr:sugar transferase [Candidatus Krumholzibacteria bacterium]MDH4336479.1 sugar transferase [Candidatus Krumholzibacteria bacterium]MDH5269071.1 sugar transferase [Candidatus Krumholzibacteria bacterium]